MNRTLFLPIVAVLAVSQVVIEPLGAQTDNTLLPQTPTKDTSSTGPLSAPLQAMKAIPAMVSNTSANKADTSVSLGASSPEKSKTLLQYMLTVPCEGWNTNAITISGFPLRTPIVGTEQSNSFIDPDLLKEYGCRQLAKRIIHRGQRKIIIDAYQFATKDGAYATYCAAHKGSSSYAPKGDASSEDQDSISFCKDQYFVYLYSTAQDDEEAKATITTMANQLIQFLVPAKEGQLFAPTKKQSELFTYMPSLERLSGSERIAMGPASLKKFFPAPYSASLASLTSGAIADYKLEYPDRDRLKLMIANYPSALEAVKTYDNYVDTLRTMHKEKSIEGYSSPAVLFKLENCFLFCQLRNNQIIVINGAKHKDSLSDLARRIYF